MTGLCIGELLALRWQDVDCRMGFFRFGKRSMKATLTSRRPSEANVRSFTVRMCRDSRSVAAHRCATLSVSLLDREKLPLCRRNLLNRQFKPVCKSLGLTGGHWHSLRHATATLHDARGTSLGTVQALLGHSSSEITRNTYIHSVPAEARKAAEEVAKLIGLNFRLSPKTRVC